MQAGGDPTEHLHLLVKCICKAGQMFRTAFAYTAPVLMALIAGPVGYVASSLSLPDRSDIYLIVGRDHVLSAALSEASIREIGPYRAPMSRLVQIPPGLHTILVGRGYWVLPASMLAELCGVSTSDQV